MISLTLNSELGQHFAKRKLLAVVSFHESDCAVPVARALLRGGVDIIEVTLRTPAALESARRILAELPEVTVGMGTVLTEKQVDEVVALGAAFAVSPSVNPTVIRHARASGLPFSPGVMTPTDVDIALSEECHLLKFFPATSSGGISHLKNIAAPFAHLGLGFIPLGGVTLENLPAWLETAHVVAVGGSWLASPREISEGAWDIIEKNALLARSCCGV